MGHASKWQVVEFKGEEREALNDSDILVIYALAAYGGSRLCNV